MSVHVLLLCLCQCRPLCATCVRGTDVSVVLPCPECDRMVTESLKPSSGLCLVWLGSSLLLLLLVVVVVVVLLLLFKENYGCL